MLNTDQQQTVGVVGAGTMGRGIVQLFAAAGHRVHCVDAVPGAARDALDAVGAMFDTLVAKGRMDADAARLARGAMSAHDDLAGLADCTLVIEAIVEDLSVKRNVFADLETIVSRDAILATNTSSLMVSEIAAGCERPERVAGLHFFNPVPLMRVVEVIAGVRTAPDVVARLRTLVASTGHRAIAAADQPGFVVNHAGRGLYTEGLRILEEQVCTHVEIDRVLRLSAGFRMGPFELLDLTGLDVSGRVMEAIYEQFQQEPRFRPSSLVPPRIAAGLHGRKSGEGWYRYQDCEREDAGLPAPAFPDGVSVWIDPEAPDAERLCALAGSHAVGQAEADSVLIVQPWGVDATTAALERGLDAARTVAVDPLPRLDRHRTAMMTAATLPRYRDAAHAMLASGDAGVTMIADSPGFICQRVLAVVVNIAANIAQRGIATVDDLEDAVRLGLGYPDGPLGWGDAIGPARVLTILEGLQRVTGDPRYRPAPWLARRARLGLSLLSPEPARHD